MTLLEWVKKRQFSLCIIVGVIAYLVYCISPWLVQPKPVEFQSFWGPSHMKLRYVESPTINPIQIVYEDKLIKRLQTILGQEIHLQKSLEGSAFRYGFNTDTVKLLVDYWRDEYLPKWKERQEYLNKYDHFMTTIVGLGIHFIHVKPGRAPPTGKYHPIPLLLLHGWPGSVREFYDIIPKLTSYSADRPYVFEVVAPSLVGYGFSQASEQEGFTTTEMANVMHQLMLRLGHDKYIIQGGDWGSAIGSQIATLFQDNVIGYHSNMCVMQNPAAMVKLYIASYWPSLFVAKENYDYHFPVKEKMKMLLLESGYFHMQATKPDTIGIALSTSPVGLAVYILEKVSLAYNYGDLNKENGGLFEKNVDMDALLDNIMIYYLTNTITSSMRFYAESMSEKQRLYMMDSVTTTVPTACARFKNDYPLAIDWMLKSKYLNLVQSTYYDFGGHFAALQVPDTLYNDFVDFVKKVNTTMFAE